jgi:peptide chain release factor 2
MEEPGFWDNPERSTKLVREAKHLKDEVDTFRELEQEYEDIQTMIQMGYEENDASLIPEIQEMLDHFSETLEKMRMKLLLSGEYDGYDAILRLNAGAGGTESCDWCSMLYRMYCRWAEKKGFKVEVLDYLDGDEAGIKSVTIQISGENAYGYLRSEHGVHRLVRISPFNAAGKRQTSFVSCDVILKKTLILRSIRTISVLIPTVPVVPVDSISIRPLLRSVLPIILQVSLLPARMSVPSSRIRTRQCRC